MNWLWIVLLIVGAAIACVLVWAYSNRKKIFKKRTKEEKKAKKQAKKILKDERNAKKVLKTIPAAPVEEKKESDELSFSEKQIEIIDNAKVASEAYVPSSDFVKSEKIEYVGMPRRMPRRRIPMETERQSSFKFDEEKKLSLKEQLQSLSPEMKAVVFANLLDKKDDLF